MVQRLSRPGPLSPHHTLVYVRRNRLIRVLACTGITCLVLVVLIQLYHSKAQSPIPATIADLLVTRSPDSATTEDILVAAPAVLANVAIDKRLVVAAVNCGFLDFVDNWIGSLQALGITNYICIGLDQNAHDVLMHSYPEHTIISFAASPSNGSALLNPKGYEYGSKEFRDVVKSRPLQLLPFLKQGYTIFYSDIDTFWMENPFDEIRQGEYDLRAATDSHPLNSDTEVGDRNICTGMLYLEPTYPAIRLLETWAELLVHTNDHSDQNSFNTALHRLKANAILSHNTTIKYAMLERDAYPPGYMFFRHDERWKNKDTYVPKRTPVIVHANWVVGKAAKRQLLKDAGLWKPIGNLSSCPVQAESR